jgi:all-trans-retinol 13,14-reductase
VEKYPAIIIGAGIGGLTAAAYLSKLGIPSMLLEQTASIGGRCSIKMINGQKHEIGALYIGGGAFDHLRDTFGVECQTIPIRCGVRVGKHMVSFPTSWRTLFELRSCGVPLSEILRFRYRSRMLSDPLTFERYESVGQVFDKVITSDVIRHFFDSLVGVSGVNPYRLPASYLSTENSAEKYKLSVPEALHEGNGEISSILVDLAQNNCKVILNAKVNKIMVKNGRALGVKTNLGEFSGQVVVSNAGLRSTILRLTDPEDWPLDFYAQVRKLESTLKVVNIFLTFSRSFNTTPGIAVFFVGSDITEGFQALDKGRFPSEPMFILHIPSNIDDNSDSDCRATLQFYYPREEVTPRCLDDQVHRIMHDGLEKLFVGFSRAITGYSVYDPIRYESEFGFPPSVFGVSPALGQHRFPVRTPIPNLLCVGDSVQPDFPCVPQAMESGIAGARIVAQYVGGISVTNE